MTVRVVLRHEAREGRSMPWRAAQWFFLAAGLLGVGYAAYSEAARYIYQSYAVQTFERAVAERQPVPANPSVIGELAIRRLGISAIVKEGVDDRTLALAVGHIPSTALPGHAGNVGVAAHRDTLFRNLRHIQQNDEITLTTLDGEYIYRVDSFKVVSPTEVSVLAPSASEKTLTLVTCYPFYFVGNAPKRFIVRARQVSIGKPDLTLKY